MIQILFLILPVERLHQQLVAFHASLGYGLCEQDTGCVAEYLCRNSGGEAISRTEARFKTTINTWLPPRSYDMHAVVKDISVIIVP